MLQFSIMLMDLLEKLSSIRSNCTTFHIFLPISVSEEREITVEIETRSTQVNNSIPIFLRYDNLNWKRDVFLGNVKEGYLL